jgi:hypothetical protein
MLPGELLIAIIWDYDVLTARDIVAMRRTCKHFNSVFTSEHTDIINSSQRNVMTRDYRVIELQIREGNIDLLNTWVELVYHGLAYMTRWDPVPVHKYDLLVVVLSRRHSIVYDNIIKYCSKLNLRELALKAAQFGHIELSMDIMFFA